MKSYSAEAEILRELRQIAYQEPYEEGGVGSLVIKCTIEDSYRILSALSTGAIGGIRPSPQDVVDRAVAAPPKAKDSTVAALRAELEAAQAPSNGASAADTDVFGEKEDEDFEPVLASVDVPPPAPANGGSLAPKVVGVPVPTPAPKPPAEPEVVKRPRGRPRKVQPVADIPPVNGLDVDDTDPETPPLAAQSLPAAPKLALAPEPPPPAPEPEPAPAPKPAPAPAPKSGAIAITPELREKVLEAQMFGQVVRAIYRAGITNPTDIEKVALTFEDESRVVAVRVAQGDALVRIKKIIDAGSIDLDI